MRCGYMDWIGLAQDRDGCRRLVSAVMNLRVPWNAVNFLTSCKPISFSRTLHHAVSCCFTTRYFPSIRQQRLPQWMQFHIHSPRTDGLQGLIHPQPVHGRTRSTFVIFFFHYVNVLAVVISLFPFHANHTKLLPLQPRRNFFQALSSHVTVVTHFSAFTTFLQMSRPKCKVNTDCNIVTAMLFTLSTDFILAHKQ